MPRWYALCHGTDLPACRLCRRHVDNNGAAAQEPKQPFITPTFVGHHCNSFIERPPHATAAITPTDNRNRKPHAYAAVGTSPRGSL